MKRGAWFEHKSEGNSTSLVELWLVRELKQRLAGVNIDAAVTSETTCDRMRIAIFSSRGFQDVATTLTTVVQESTMTPATFRNAKNELTRRRLVTKRNPRRPRRAWQKFVAAMTLPDHHKPESDDSHAGTIPSLRHVQTYWSRMKEESDIAITCFGPWPTVPRRHLMKLIQRTNIPRIARWKASEMRAIHLPRLHGVRWKESSFHPLYAIVDTIMTLRTNGTRLRYDCGQRRGYGVIGSQREAEAVLYRAIDRPEWMAAKGELLRFLRHVDDAREDYAFYLDDMDAWAYASFRIRSFEDFIEFIRSSSYDKLCAYVRSIHVFCGAPTKLTRAA